MAGPTPAVGGAGAGAAHFCFFRCGWGKSSVMPSRKMIGTIVSAAITATLPPSLRRKGPKRLAFMGCANAYQKLNARRRSAFSSDDPRLTECILGGIVLSKPYVSNLETQYGDVAKLTG